MELARSVPQIAAILRERNAFGVEQVAGMVGPAAGREPDDPDVLLFSGIVLADEPTGVPAAVRPQSS